MGHDLHAVAAAAARLEAARESLACAVDAARLQGATWADVGQALGTSRQAAFKRFGHPRDPRDADTTTPRAPATSPR